LDWAKKLGTKKTDPHEAGAGKAKGQRQPPERTPENCKSMRKNGGGSLYLILHFNPDFLKI